MSKKINDITFYKWLIENAERDDPIGDFAREVKNDPRCTLRGVSTQEEWVRYLEYNDVNEELSYQVLDLCWKEFIGIYDLKEILSFLNWQGVNFYVTGSGCHRDISAEDVSTYLADNTIVMK